MGRHGKLPQFAQHPPHLTAVLYAHSTVRFLCVRTQPGLWLKVLTSSQPDASSLSGMPDKAQDKANKKDRNSFHSFTGVLMGNNTWHNSLDYVRIVLCW